MLTLLVYCLVAVIVCGILYWIVTLIPLPPPFKTIAMVVILLFLLIFIIYLFFGSGSLDMHGPVLRR
jgi:hypothetical protein